MTVWTRSHDFLHLSRVAGLLFSLNCHQNTRVFTMKILFVALLTSVCVLAQTPCPESAVNCSSVPRLVRFTGALIDATGVPRTGIAGITFSIYDQSIGGTALWQETQNVVLDSEGRYAILLGMTNPDGLPVDIFNSPDSKWLGVWPQFQGEQEHARIPLVSVPYAFKAKDAETLQGLPASAFLKAPTASQTINGAISASASGLPGSAGSSGKSRAATTESPVTTVGGGINAIPKFDSPTSIVPSQISESNGMIGMQNLANILFADQFPNGVPDAVKACPASGCVIYAYSPNVNLNLGTIDPGTKSVTLYLGPYTYNVTQITLRSSLKIIGMGARATTLQSTNGNNPPIVIVQSQNGAAQHVLLSGLNIMGSPGNTSEDGIFLDSSQNYNSGMWFSEFRDLNIGGFAGIGLHIKGTNADFSGMTQFSEFDRVVVWRMKGGGNALKVEGAAYNLHFNDCEFEGPGIGDGTNIFVGRRPGNSWAMPIDINFLGLTSEGAATAVQIDGGWHINFDHPHHENVWGVYLVTGDLGVGVVGLTISGAGFQNVGTNNGNGYLLNVETNSALGIRFIHNHIMNPVDIAVRVKDGANVTYEDNVYFGNTDLPLTQGIAHTITPAAAINIGGAHVISLNTSSTPITTIKSSLGPGETTTFYTVNGPVSFGSGGNITLLGAQQITVNGSITFVVTDAGNTPSWVPVSQWSSPSSGNRAFTLSSSESALNLLPGTTSTTNLSLTPLGGFSGNIALRCSEATGAISCSVSPHVVTANDSSPIDVSLEVTSLSAPVPTATRTDRSQASLVALSANACAFGLLIPYLSLRSRQRLYKPLLTLCMILLVIGIAACGTPHSSPSIFPQEQKYKLIISATGGSYSQVLDITVIVNES